MATLVNDFFTLKEDCIKVEAEVYEFARILQCMSTKRADKFKAQLWQAWYDMQNIIRQFGGIVVNEAAINEVLNLISSQSDGLMEVQLKMDELRDKITQTRGVLQNDL